MGQLFFWYFVYFLLYFVALSPETSLFSPEQKTSEKFMSILCTFFDY